MTSEPGQAGRRPQVAILTVSDRCARGESIDRSGPVLAALLEERLGATIVANACVPDDRRAIAEQVKAWALPGSGIDLVLSTGGTGLGPRDITPEAVGPLIERLAPGLMELARMRTAAKTPRTFLSRGIAGSIGSTLVLTLPGSPRGALEQCEARHKSEQAAGKVRVTCIVSHSAGYSENTTLEASEDHSGNKNTIQAIGSAATYLQRYTLKLALGLSASTDDDGQGGKKVKSSAQAKRDGDMTKFNEIKRDIESAINVEHLKHVNEIHSDEIEAMPHGWYELLKQDYDAKLDALQAVTA